MVSDYHTSLPTGICLCMILTECKTEYNNVARSPNLSPDQVKLAKVCQSCGYVTRQMIKLPPYGFICLLQTVFKDWRVFLLVDKARYIERAT